MARRDPNSYLKRVLDRLLPDASLDSNRSERLVLRHEDTAYLLSSSSVHAPRISDILGQLAVSILEQRDGPRNQTYRPLCVTITPRFGGRTVQAVQAFMAKHAPQTAWALIDHKGHAHFEDPVSRQRLDHFVDAAKELKAADVVVPPPSPSKLFSDLNIWMLKILVLRRVPQKHWQGPREKVLHPTHLSRVAGVSTHTAHVFVKALVDLGFAEVTRNGLVLYRKPELLERLLSFARNRSLALAPARSVFGIPPDLHGLSRVELTGRFALGGMEAAQQHGLRHATGGIPWLHVEGSLEQYLELWNLQTCEPSRAEVALLTTRSNSSVLRGALDLDGLPVVDILQCAIDATKEPGRGMEQAEFLIERILQYDEP